MNQRIKVLHFIDSLWLGGAQTVVRELLAHADRERFEIGVASLHGPGPFARRLRGLGYPVTHLSRSKLDPALPARFVHYVRRTRPDILHLHLVVSCLLGEYLRVLLPRETRVICHVQNLFQKHEEAKYQDYLEPFLYKRCTAVVSCGPGVTKDLKMNLKGRHAPIVTVPNGVDDRRLVGRNTRERERVRGEMKVPAARPVFLSASRLMQQKNLGHALKVFYEVLGHAPNAEYWIAGTGVQEDFLKKKSRDLGLGDRVKFLGFRDDVPELMSGADFFLLPSLHEGLSLALIEAMGSELVPIVTPFVGAEEMIHDGVTGIVIPFDDPEAAGKKIHRLIADKEEGKRVAGRALEIARNRYSASAMARRMERLYERLAD